MLHQLLITRNSKSLLLDNGECTDKIMCMHTYPYTYIITYVAIDYGL